MLQFKSFLQSAAGRITGDTDVLEGILAIGLAVGAADGKLSRDEVNATVNSAKANDLVKRLFTDDVIDLAKDRLLAKLKAGGGFEVLYKELKDLAAREAVVRHAVYTVGVNVASQDGVDDKEQAVLDQCSDFLNILEEDKLEIENNAKSNKIELDF